MQPYPPTQPYHEFKNADGSVLPHQQLLADFLRRHTKEQAEEVRRAVQSRLLEQEVSFNLLGNPEGSERSWVLDEIPHVMPGEEFLSLADKIASRARLLSAALEDVYGPQRLIRERIIPEQLVLGNPRYFRSLQGLKPLGGQRLVFYAIDVAKTSDGSYVVHSDRSAAPTGAGYALENRLAIGQILAEPFRDYRVRKVNRFFETMSETLKGLTPRADSAPRIVLLTPGQHDESSFEHGYMARYQGWELVEGRDLTVRGNEVFLKTLEGLKRVDVIMRRIADDWCDPLELRDDSLLGISGLVGAARAGTVGIANPLGSGLLECPVFRAYLPAVSRALEGQELAIPSVPSRYLGDNLHREEVLDTWDSWTIRPAFYDRRGPATLNSALDLKQSEQLKQKVLAQPGIYAAERSVTASRVPLGMTLSREGSLSLRMFACYNGVGYSVMPGGLARANASPDGLFLHGEESVTSKDVWVIGGKDAVEPAPPRMPETPLKIRRGGIDLPSRLFDDIFWLGRYTERCDGAGRLVRAGLEPIMEDSRDVAPEVAGALRKVLVSLHLASPAAAKSDSLESILMGALNNRSLDNSIHACLDRIHGLTTGTRSRLSSDTWNTLRRLTVVKKESGSVSAEQAVHEVEETLQHLSAFRGLVTSNMVRGHAWVFLEMGRRIESGVFVLTLIVHLFSQGQSRLLMETLLRLCDSLLTYRSRYLSTLQATPVVDLVLTDSSNPQSVLFQVQSLLWCVRQLPKESPFPLSRAEQRLVRLEANLVTADLDAACAKKAQGLRQLAEEGIKLLWQVSDDISRTYFTHAELSRSMSYQGPGEPTRGGDV